MKNWNQPVYPQLSSISYGEHQETQTDNPGMTLLDYYVGQVASNLNPDDYNHYNDYACACFGIALNILKEREQVIEKLENTKASKP